MKTIPQDLIRDKIFLVNYVEYIGTSGADEHFYIAVRQEDMEKFKAAIKRGNFEAEDYGLILEHGFGPAPMDVRNRMKMLYKCDHDTAINVVDYTPPAE